MNSGPTLERFKYPEIFATLRGSSEAEGLEDDFPHPFGRGDGRSRERYKCLPGMMPEEGFKYPFPLRSGQDFGRTFIRHISQHRFAKIFHFHSFIFGHRYPNKDCVGGHHQRPLTADVEGARTDTLALVPYPT